MAFMRSQLSLVLLLAVIYAVTAENATGMEWLEEVKKSNESIKWCAVNDNAQKCIGTDKKVSDTVSGCWMPYLKLMSLVGDHYPSSNFSTEEQDKGLAQASALVLDTVTFCSNVPAPTNQPPSTEPASKDTTTESTTKTSPSGTTTNAITSPTTIASTSTGSSTIESSTKSSPSSTGTVPSSTGTVPDAEKTSPAGDNKTLEGPTSANPEAAESNETNHLYWILPVIGLVLIAMIIGGIYIHRYAKKSGYHHSSKTNGEAAKGTGESA